MQIAKDELHALVPQLSGRRVLVIGDLFLDQYIVGRPTRLSREAPIPVLELVRQFWVPGGAANPAHNVRALGSTALVAGVVGDDGPGLQLRSELEKAGLEPSGLVVDRGRPTTTKTRIMAEGGLRFPQQLARIDHLDRHPIAGDVETELVRRVHELTPVVDAVLLSDYQTGVLSTELAKKAVQAARSVNKLCTVDAQGAFGKYPGVDLVKGNRQEIEAALSRELVSDDDHRWAGDRLCRDLGTELVVITRGAEGLSLTSRTEGYAHLPAANRTEVFDVTGAGDTVIAVATLALLAGGSALAAASLANLAAGLVVRKLGNAVPSADELHWAIDHW